jgi:3-oxoacyl-(acyl-carrier-protein) synthase
LDIVWQRLEAGDVAEPKPLSNPETGRVHHAIPVPPKLVEHLGRNPRLRRSSAISYFAVSAGLAALKDAGLELTPENMAKTAVVFAVSDGGVVYTRKLYEQIVKQGANAASPLLFPETVYNAPASHLASQLGIDGMSYTLVGDASTAMSAVNFAAELLAIGEADHVLVVAAEELDWILCDAYRDWRLARTPLAEGAGAIVLSRTGRWSVAVGPGVPFQNQRGAGGALRRALSGLDLTGVDLLISPENGTFIDRALSENAAAWEPSSPLVLTPKHQLGEMIGAAGLVQLVIGAMGLEKLGLAKALVPVIGFNHQADAAVVSRS